MDTWTIQKLLSWVTEYLTTKGVDAPRLSAELLLCHVVGLTRIELYTNFDRPVSQGQLDRLRDLVRRAGLHEPVAYLTGRTEFYSIELDITNDCLIPRPETELLVQRAIEFLRTRDGMQFVCDLCTGSGCIAVAIAKNFPNTRVIATDISAGALEVAARNVAKYDLNGKIKLLQGDLFEPLIGQLDITEFDLIVCNPPYVSSSEYDTLAKNVRDYEPKSALLAGTDGLEIYRRLIGKVDQFLKGGSSLMLEIGYAQGPAVRELLERTGAFNQIKTEKDHHDNDRVVMATRISRRSNI